MSTALESDTRLNLIKRRVTFTGIAPVMFDRYAGDNNTKLQWHEKIYLAPGSNILSLPTLNLSSYLSSHNTNSAPKRLRDARKYKAIANACLSFVGFEALDGSQNIQFTKHGNPIEVGTFQDDHDPKSGIFLHRSVARLEKGIPNPKERPVLPLDWELSFNLIIYPNKEIKEAEVKNLLIEGGYAIGIGTYRGLFGKYEVTQWD